MADNTQALQFAFDRLGSIAQHYGPSAIDLAVRAARMEGVASIIEGVIALGVSLVCLALVRRALKKLPETADEAPWIVVLVGGGILGIISAIVACCGLFDVWAWTALFDPKLALAHDILTALTAKASS